jgi:diguanylate cyclase (GGDEF)-like protein
MRALASRILPASWRLPAVFGTAPARIAIGVMSLLVCVLLLLDAGFSGLNSRELRAREQRLQASEAIGQQLAVVLRQLDERGLRRVVQQLAANEPGLLSIGVRRDDGSMAAATDAHIGTWTGQAANPMREATLPLWKGDERWGQVEIAYGPLEWKGPLGGFVDTPALFVLCFIGVGGLIAYGFMRRALVHLDPSTAVPTRVRNAYDTLTEGVVILDAQDRIVLANAAFRTLCGLVGVDGNELHGKRIGELERLGESLPFHEKGRSWADIAQAGEFADGTPIDVPQSQGAARKVVLRCAPIRDNAEKLRGSLMSFNDQTAVEQANARLTQANAALEASRKQIAQQNTQLLHLANHDGLTGCLNRRAFFSQAEQLVERAQADGRRVAVVMVDVDHFKSFNDRFGHSVGDDVLRGVARTLGESLPKEALLGRYGGEEFCVLLQDVDRHGALQVAERLRYHVETSAGAALGHSVTASFGLAAITGIRMPLAQLLDRADQALYRAKQDGRNRVAVAVGTGCVSVPPGEVASRQHVIADTVRGELVDLPEPAARHERLDARASTFGSDGPGSA